MAVVINVKRMKCLNIDSIDDTDNIKSNESVFQTLKEFDKIRVQDSCTSVV